MTLLPPVWWGRLPCEGDSMVREGEGRRGWGGVGSTARTSARASPAAGAAGSRPRRCYHRITAPSIAVRSQGFACASPSKAESTQLIGLHARGEGMGGRGRRRTGRSTLEKGNGTPTSFEVLTNPPGSAGRREVSYPARPTPANLDPPPCCKRPPRPKIYILFFTLGLTCVNMLP